MDQLPARLNVEALHARLRERLPELHPLIVADVMRVFVEVSSLECDKMLWSLEFAFDEDDGRVARIAAQFAEKNTREPSGGALQGYEVHVLLPKVIPASTPVGGLRAAERAREQAAQDSSLVSRFVGALAELGAYRTIEPLEALSAEAYLL